MEERGFKSRKFLTTNSAMLQGTALMVFGALIKPPVEFWGAMGAYFVLMGLGIAAYNWANLRESTAPKQPPAGS